MSMISVDLRLPTPLSTRKDHIYGHFWRKSGFFKPKLNTSEASLKVIKPGLLNRNRFAIWV